VRSYPANSVDFSSVLPSDAFKFELPSPLATCDETAPVAPLPVLLGGLGLLVVAFAAALPHHRESALRLFRCERGREGCGHALAGIVARPAARCAAPYIPGQHSQDTRAQYGGAAALAAPHHLREVVCVCGRFRCLY
jgi:hypothetical protein